MRVLTICLLLFATAARAQITPDFQAWLNANGYESYDFARADVPGGSYGGRETKRQKVVHQPVIFIHGNSDRALGGGSQYTTGWRTSIDFFRSKGYTSAELYATTWGAADITLVAQQYHSKANIGRVRAFIEAVKKYTGAKQVDIVAHSMGVTLARKAIKGGSAFDEAAGGTYDLGTPLTKNIDTFVGIAAANRGVPACAAPVVPTCSNRNGFHPESELLADLNASQHYEGKFVYTIWSSADPLITNASATSPIPGQDGEVAFDALPYGHIGVKDLTAEIQWRMVTKHATK